jgi:hypothetical protein
MDCGDMSPLSKRGHIRAVQMKIAVMKTKKNWREKLVNDKGLPKICEVTGKLTKRWGTGRFVIPAPREVDALMKQVPRGRVVTINGLRLPADDGNFFVDRRARRRRSGSGRRKTHHAFLENAQNRRRDKSEISRRR